MPDQTRRAAQPQAQAPLRRPVPPPPVRRNLFQSQLTRRPTPAANSAEAMRLEASVDVLSDSDEIVVRDKDGEVEVEGPEGVGEDGVVDEKEEMESMSRPFCCPSLAHILALVKLTGNADDCRGQKEAHGSCEAPADGPGSQFGPG